MKFVKRITVFFIMPMFMFACGFAASTAIMEFFYPGRPAAERGTAAREAVDAKLAEAKENKLEHLVGEGASEEPKTEEPEALEVSIRSDSTINADTIYVVQEYDRISGTLGEETISVPDTFLGMNRDLFVRSIEEFNDYPSLHEQEKGFIGCEVISFSPQRVVVRKSYELEEMPEGFYLVNENDFVVVYYGDLRTVYMNTNINLQKLPEGLRQEIIYIKYMEKEEDLYSFLETYSS